MSKSRAPEITVAAGDVVVRQGDPGSDMYVIASGRVRIIRVEANGTVIDRGTRGRGEFFGEMSVLESLVRIRRDPTFCLALLRQLSGALRESVRAGDPAALP